MTRRAGAPIAASHDEFLRRLDGLVVGRSASHGVFDGVTFLHPGLDVHVRFPSGWSIANNRQIVAAGAPDGRAVIALELAGQGTDPEAALEAFARETKISLTPPERLTIGGLPAARSTATVRTRDGWLALELTCIAHAGRLFTITGATPLGAAETARPAFRETAASFRPLTTGEWAGIREARLRLVRARADERLGVLVARAHGAWSAAMAAVANALEADTPLDAGTLVKVATLEPYTPRDRGR